MLKHFLYNNSNQKILRQILLILSICVLINAQEDASFPSLQACKSMCNQPQQICQKQNSGGSIVSFSCVHQGILPLEPLTIVGFVVGFALAICSCLAGIGGGVFNILIGMILFQMTLQQAAPFSITVVVISMTFRFFYQLIKKERHPEKNQPIVNYSLSAMIAPSLCAGSLVGVKANKILPEFFVSIIFVLLMIYCIWTTQAKYKEIRGKEVAYKNKSLLKKLLKDQKQKEQESEESQRQEQYFVQDQNNSVQFDANKQQIQQIITIPVVVYDKDKKKFIDKDANEKDQQQQDTSQSSSFTYNDYSEQQSEEQQKQLQFSTSSMQQEEKDSFNVESETEQNADQNKIKNNQNNNLQDKQTQIEEDNLETLLQVQDQNKQQKMQQTQNVVAVIQTQNTQKQSQIKNSKIQTASSIQRKIANDIKKMKKVKSIMRRESKQLHLDSLFIILVVIVVLFIIELFRGSAVMSSIIGVPYCQLSYWILAFIYIPIALVMIFGIVKYYKRQHNIKLENDYEFHETDIQYSNINIIKINLYGFFVGTMASLLGIGGGVVLTPIINQLIHTPSEASYTSCFITLYLSLVNFILYILLNSIIWDYAIPYGVLCLLGFVIGQRLASYIKKIKKQSLIILMLQVAIVIALVAMVYTETMRLISQIKGHKNFIQFKSLCTSAK